MNISYSKYLGSEVFQVPDLHGFCNICIILNSWASLIQTSYIGNAPISTSFLFYVGAQKVLSLGALWISNFWIRDVHPVFQTLLAIHSGILLPKLQFVSWKFCSPLLPMNQKYLMLSDNYEISVLRFYSAVFVLTF